MEWKIVPVENVNVDMGTIATFRKNPEGSGSLLIRDGINKGKDIPLPISVVTEIALRDKAMQLEVAGMVDPATRTQVEKFWYFVDGCLPEDGTTEGNQSSGSGTVAHDAVENITTCQLGPSEKTN